MEPATDAAALPPRTRVLMIVSTILLHLACYVAVNRLNAHVPASALWDFTLPIDSRIPYLGWTAAIY